MRASAIKRIICCACDTYDALLCLRTGDIDTLHAGRDHTIEIADNNDTFG